MNATALILTVLISFGLQTPGQIYNKVQKTVKEQTLVTAAQNLEEEPLTVTAAAAGRSQGGIHDFYSEGDYWWPDPKNPDGPYIRRDGETNPENFTAHRFYMVRMSMIVGNLTSAYLITKDEAYLKQIERHIKAWFVDPETMMNPNLEYAQAIKGVSKGRGIGIIDTLHLIEVAQSLYCLSDLGVMDKGILEGAREWFRQYLSWMYNSSNGQDEMKARNNHGTCWALQAAAFARFTGDEAMLEHCRKMYREIFLPSQMAADGSFPEEIARTKPYGYSLFNLDQMATLAIILGEWDFTLEDGRNMDKGMEYMVQYIRDKDSWPYEPDVMFFEYWPVAQPCLLFSAICGGRKDCLKLWKGLDHFPTNEEVLRNLPLRNPLIWLSRR